jgi:hemin uptake protein HemP
MFDPKIVYQLFGISDYIVYINSINKYTDMKQTTKTGRRNQVTTYVPIANNIYHDGSSYRVRVRVQGKTVSKNFSNKRKAISFRNQLWGA